MGAAVYYSTSKTLFILLEFLHIMVDTSPNPVPFIKLVPTLATLHKIYSS